jgi:hypothetical protein
MKIDKLIRPGEFINLRLRFGVGRALFRAFLLVISTALAAAVLVKYTGWIDWGEGLTFLTLSVLLAFVMLVYWLRAGVILTNQRLLEQKGAIGAVVNEIELSEIKDFIVLHNYFGRPANLKIQMTDDDVYTIEDVSGMDGLGNALAVAINKPPAKYQTNRR